MAELDLQAQREAAAALQRMYGIVLPERRMRGLSAALRRVGGVAGVQAGLERLLGNDLQAWEEVIDAMATPETYLFRHFPHFALLGEVALERQRRGRACRVLSAGCSSGEEVWSAAAVLAGTCPQPERRGWVVGWDANVRRLAMAEAGRYRSWSVRGGLHGYEACFERVGEEYRVSDALRARARFEHVNLMGPLPSARFDVIFFRNVAIYFDRTTAQAIAMRLADLLEEDGLLLVGPSDPVSLPSSHWEHIIAQGVRSYRRRAETETRARQGAPIARPPVAAPEAPSVPCCRPSNDVRAVECSSEPVLSPAVDDPFAEVAQLANEGAYERALVTLQSIDAPLPEHAQWEGLLHLNLGDGERAIAAFRRCVYLQPETARYRRWLAEAYASAGMPHEAQRERRNARLLEEAS